MILVAIAGALLFALAFVFLVWLIVKIILDVKFILQDKANQFESKFNPLKIIYTKHGMSPASESRRKRLIIKCKYLFVYWLIFMFLSVLSENFV